MYDVFKPVSIDGVPTGDPPGPNSEKLSVLPGEGLYVSRPPLVVTVPVLVPLNCSVARCPLDITIRGCVRVLSTVIVPAFEKVMTWPAAPLAATVAPFCTTTPVDVHRPTRQESIAGVGLALAVEAGPEPPHATRTRVPRPMTISRCTGR